MAAVLLPLLLPGLLLAAPSAPADPEQQQGWTVKQGALDAGNDIGTPANHTIAEAEAVCAGLHGCAGFTFKSNHSQPAGRVKCYFKSVAQSNVDGLWWTYLKPKPAFRFANTQGDHMVLQQAPAKAQVWGFAAAGASVTVTSTASGAAPVTVSAGADGTRAAALAPVVASTTAVNLSASSGGETITLLDVLYGDVFFCSGQSNMQFTVQQTFNATAELALAADYPHVRLFTAADVASSVSLVELAAVLQPWSVASPTTLAGGNFTFFSAVCWFTVRATRTCSLL